MVKKRRFLAGLLAAAFMTAAAPSASAQVQPPAITPAAIVQIGGQIAVQADTVKPAPAAPVFDTAKIDVSAMTEWRHDIHQHPETAYEEVRTAQKINDLLQSWGLETHTNIGKTGVVGILRGPNTDANSPAICLRADMDALPMTEAHPDLAYQSQTPGKDHACGHDGHVAMLLGAAKYLAETKNFTGTVYFIFQPAEEGGAGAKAMMDDGLFDIVKCDGIYGMHAWPGLKEGQIAVSPGSITAASDKFSIQIKGKGGHAAYPADNIDAISMAADIVAALHKVKDAAAPADEGAVLAVTMLHGGEAVNVMPETVELKGTVRTFSGATQDKIEKGMKDEVARIAAQYGATAEVTYERNYPSVVNAAAETKNAVAAANDAVGADNVVPFSRTMAGEDFSFYEAKVPGAYIALGQWDGVSAKTQLHSPQFNFNDNTLKTGASYWIALVQNNLPKKDAPPAAAQTAKPPAP